MSSDPRTEAGRIMFEYLAEHNLFVHDRIDDQLAEQFRAIEDESWNAALAAVEEAARELNPRTRLTHKADDPEASFDPLILETEILAAVASLRRKPGQPPAPEEER